MSYVDNIGRVGALAVALGVGLAAASAPGIAYAQESNSNTSTTNDTSAPTDAKPTADTPTDTAPVDAGETAVEEDDLADPKSPSDPADDEQPSAETDPVADADTADDLEKDLEQADENGADGPAGDKDSAPDVEQPGGGNDKLAVDDVTDHQLAKDATFFEPDSDDDVDLFDTTVKLPSPDLDVTVLDDVPATNLDVPDVFTAIPAATPTSLSAPPKLAKVVEESAATPANALAELVDALLKVLAPLGPDSPLNSSVILAALSSARDELENALFPAAQPASQQSAAQLAAPGQIDLNVLGEAPPQVQLVLPSLVEPDTWLPFVGDVAYDFRVLVHRNIAIYDFNTPEGWAAFALDYSWGLPGTTLGYGIQFINFFWETDPIYRNDLSYHKNRHVYEGGFYVKEGYAHTQGNTTTNMGFNGAGVSENVLENHESLHIQQSRMWGPLYQGTYVVWAAGGVLVAAGYWLAHPEEDFGDLVTTTAYIDNPFEYMAYKNADHWPPSAAHPDLILWPVD